MAELIDVGAEQGRRKFLRTAAAGAAGGALVATSQVSADHFTRTDAQQLALGSVNFKDILAHKAAHVDFLNTYPPQRPRPTFRNNLRMSGFHVFLERATFFSNLEVAVYQRAIAWASFGQLSEKLSAVGLITARHAGWLNSLSGFKLTTSAADASQTVEGTFSIGVITNAIDPYIQSYNGAEFGFPQLRDGFNDPGIINSVVLMAMFMHAFYNVNVYRFFP